MKDSYSKTTEKALLILIPCMSTYLREAGFSTLLQIKTKQRNRLDVQDDQRCALSQTIPRIQQLLDQWFSNFLQSGRTYNATNNSGHTLYKNAPECHN